MFKSKNVEGRNMRKSFVSSKIIYTALKNSKNAHGIGDVLIRSLKLYFLA